MNITANAQAALSDWTVTVHDEKLFPNIWDATKILSDNKLAVISHTKVEDGEWVVFEATTNELTETGEFDWDSKVAWNLDTNVGGNHPTTLVYDEDEALKAALALS